MGLGTWEKTGIPEDRITGLPRNPQSAIRNPQSLPVRQAGAIGFTLVELLVVISIIALLVGILLPSLGKARQYAANLRTSARIAELAGGCNMYFTENEYYPGQPNPLELKGSGGNFTGSQWLARSLFTDPAATPQYPKPKYAPLKASEDLFDYEVSPTEIYSDTISDRYTTGGIEPLAVLYYPARLGVSGLTQYQMADNSDYVTGHTKTGGKTFDEFITDTRFSSSSTTPYHPGAFLIIAAGMDRLYFTPDDICYPAFSGK